MQGAGRRYRPFSLQQLPTVEEARARWLASLPAVEPPDEVVPLWQAGGRVLAEDVVAEQAIPPFPRSLMDGVALRAADVRGASEASPVRLRIAGRVRMGQRPDFALAPGEGALIPTGGMLPEGADAVIPAEEFPELLAAGDPAAEPESVVVVRPVPAGENVIPAGADVSPGAQVMAKGHRLRPQDVGVLAGLGRVSVRVRRIPEVAILSTGNEIVAPEQSPAAGQVRDMNGPSLAAAVAAAGGRPRVMGVVSDDREQLLAALQSGLTSDMLVVSGGSSVGEEDWVARLVGELGPPGIIVHGVKMAPGKPTLCALVGRRPVLGLPGNPVSALVVFRLFGVPALRRLAGEREPAGWEPVVRARLGAAVRGTAGRALYMRVALERGAGGEWVAQPIRGGSSQLMTMVKADGLIAVPADATLPEGAWVDVHPW